MQKLIPILYFYILSIIGMVLFIIGLFHTFHYVIGTTMYEKYPLRYNAESRCDFIGRPVPLDAKATLEVNKEVKSDCLKSLEQERINTKIDDLEKSIAFTIIGLLVFGIHFYLARKERREVK